MKIIPAPKPTIHQFLLAVFLVGQTLYFTYPYDFSRYSNGRWIAMLVLVLFILGFVIYQLSQKQITISKENNSWKMDYMLFGIKLFSRSKSLSEKTDYISIVKGTAHYKLKFFTSEGKSLHVFIFMSEKHARAVATAAVQELQLGLYDANAHQWLQELIWRDFLIEIHYAFAA